MPDTGLKTRMRLIPLLLCCMSGAVFAAEMQPLVVSPDLVRGGKSPRGAASAAAGGVQPDTKKRGTPATQDAGVTVLPVPGPDEEGTPARTRQAEREQRISDSIQKKAPSAGQPDTVTLPAEESRASGSVSPAGAPALPALPAESTQLRALRISGTRAVELTAEGDAELQRDDLLLTADRLIYRELTDEAIAEGNVSLQQRTDKMTGPSANLFIGERVGAFQSPQYAITRERPALVEGEPPRTVSGSGHADVMFFEGENQYRLENATWTTCQATDPDWYVRADTLNLDYDREIGTAKGGSLIFQGVPIFWMPWAEFPLAGQRQSGFLPPTFGSSNTTGVDLSVPYYWNIAPNYDATLSPRYMGRRGLQLGGEVRYLGHSYRGEARAEYLDNDNVTGERRSLGAWQHQQWLTPSLYGSLDLNGVSDAMYFKDLSSRISVTSRVNLLREGRLLYTGGGWWSASALAQSYQTLNTDPENRIVTPYRRLPQLALNANRPDLPWGLAASFQSEYSQFAHPERNMAEGGRMVAYPSVSLPYQRAGYYVTPKVGLHMTKYDLDRTLPGGRDSINRNVPIFSVDSGMTFERDVSLFGGSYAQTLEPRLYYLNVPYRRQDDIPLFDTSRLDFGFAQLFSENLYTGSDRIADANQLTATVTSRLIDSETGAERIRALIGQRYYFEDQRVTLNERGRDPVEVPRSGRRADILTGLSGKVGTYSTLYSLVQYNPRENWTERFNATYRYQPAFAKAMNVSYRYTKDVLRDVDVSGQWPLVGRWYGVGRVTHSLKDDRLTEAIAGLEYDGGCWVLRTVLHRFVTDSSDSTRAIFVQLELNDLASVGSDPLSLIRRSVSGYGKINEPLSNRVFGNE